MKTNEIMKSVSLTFNKVGFQLQKKSPEILVAAGVVGVVVSAVMACQATPKALKVAEKTQNDVERIQSCLLYTSIRSITTAPCSLSANGAWR